MSIIEREIKRREDFIKERADKLEQAAKMETEAATIRREYEPISIDTLLAEVEELRAFLPKPETEV